MLIISKHHDYMDVISKLGVDKSVVWQRKSAEYEVDRGKIYLPETEEYVSLSYCPQPMNYSVWDRKGNSVAFERLYLGYCGETYKILIKYGKYHYENVKTWQEQEVFFNPTDEEVEAIEDKKHTYKPKRYRERQVEQEFNLDLFQILKCPIFLLREVDRRVWLITNPVLKDFDFVRVKDPYTAFQEISSFISGVLGNTEKETVEISDSDRMLQHGFDKKFSFRHPIK